MYVSYVRPLLEYSAILWNGTSVKNKDRLEKIQHEAARTVTGLTRSVSVNNLYKECEWTSLAHRRKFQKLCFVYKCTNNLSPEYILDFIPPLVQDTSNYHLRNRSNITNKYTRTAVFSRFCSPSSVLLWNNLDDSL